MEPIAVTLENSWVKRFGFGLLIGAAAILFLLRGPLRAFNDHGLNDLLSPYIQSTAWVHGADPYSTQSLLRFWPASAAAAMPAKQVMQNGSVLIRHGIPTAYPLTCFVIMAPFTNIPFPIFKALWIIATGVLFCATVLALIAIAGIEGRYKPVFVLGSVLLAPIHTGIATCNPAIIAIELAVIAVWASHQKRDLTSVILTAVCIALKPQIGLAFVIYYLVCRRWKICLHVLGVVFAIAVAAILRLSVIGVHWLASYEHDSRALLADGVLGDFTERNPTRFGLVNLQVAFYSLSHNRELANLLALLCCLALMAGLFYFTRRFRTDDALLYISAITIITLLPIYHRFYDAGLLIIPLCCLTQGLATREVVVNPYLKRSSVVGLSILCAFVIPGGSLLERISSKGIFPPGLLASSWWNGFVMAHAGWCLLVISLVLLFQLYVRAGAVKDKTEDLAVSQAPTSFGAI